MFVPECRVAPTMIQNGFRWLHASGTTIGSYKNGNGTLAALRPVYPGGSSVFGISAITRYRWHKANGELVAIGDSGSCQLPPPPGRAGRKPQAKTTSDFRERKRWRRSGLIATLDGCFDFVLLADVGVIVDGQFHIFWKRSDRLNILHG